MAELEQDETKLTKYLSESLPPNDIDASKERWKNIVKLGKELGINFEDFKESETPDSDEILRLVSEL